LKLTHVTGRQHGTPSSFEVGSKYHHATTEATVVVEMAART